MRLWAAIGRIAFWTSWPLLFVYLSFTRRTRIVVAVGDDVLVVKGWLDSGKWGLPGGGLHRNEDPAQGAIRELREETGIGAKASQLTPLFSGRMSSGHGLRFMAEAFALELPAKPKLSKQKLELTDLRWTDWHSLIKDPSTGQDTQAIIDSWRTTK